MMYDGRRRRTFDTLSYDQLTTTTHTALMRRMARSMHDIERACAWYDVVTSLHRILIWDGDGEGGGYQL